MLVILPQLYALHNKEAPYNAQAALEWSQGLSR